MSNKKAKGPRSKTRDLFKNRVRPTVNKLLDDFKVGTGVLVKINSSVHAGIPNKRFHGLCGKVKGKRGNSFVVSVKKGNSLKTLIVHPAHLAAYGGSLK